MSKTMKRFMILVLLTIVSVGLKAEETNGEEPIRVKVDISEFKGGSVVEKEQSRVVTKNEKDEEVVTYNVTITVSPNPGYYITKEDIVVVGTYPLPQKEQNETRTEEENEKQVLIAGALELTGEDPEDLTTERTYSFTLEDGLGAWVQEANFHEIASSGKIGEVAWELTADETKGQDKKLTLTLDGEGGASLDDGTAPWAMKASEITNVVISKDIIALGDGILAGCTNLTEIEIKNADGIVTLGTDALPANEGLKVYVPGNLFNLYQMTDGWKELALDTKDAVKMEGVKFVKDKNEYDVYAAPADQDLMVPYGVEAYDITGIQGNKILWKNVETISKGKVVLLYGGAIKTDDLRTAAAPNMSRTRAGEGEEEPIIKCALKVVEYDPEKKKEEQGKKVNLGQVYLLYNDVFYLSQAGIIPVGGIYLEITKDDEEAPVTKTRSFLTIGGDDNNTTAIGGAVRLIDKGQMINDKWYDLSGRRLSTQPTAKGVYIRNGKKVVIK